MDYKFTNELEMELLTLGFRPSGNTSRMTLELLSFDVYYEMQWGWALRLMGVPHHQWGVGFSIFCPFQSLDVMR
jgi:hypothetical protein